MEKVKRSGPHVLRNLAMVGVVALAVFVVFFALSPKQIKLNGRLVKDGQPGVQDGSYDMRVRLFDLVDPSKLVYETTTRGEVTNGQFEASFKPPATVLERPAVAVICVNAGEGTVEGPEVCQSNGGASYGEVLCSPYYIAPHSLDFGSVLTGRNKLNASDQHDTCAGDSDSTVGSIVNIGGGFANQPTDVDSDKTKTELAALNQKVAGLELKLEGTTLKLGDSTINLEEFAQNLPEGLVTKVSNTTTQNVTNQHVTNQTTNISGGITVDSGTNITTIGNGTGTVTVSTVSNPTFSGGVTTDIINPSTALTINGDTTVAGDLSFNGALRLGGSSGTAGEFLVSQGAGIPIWQSYDFNAIADARISLQKAQANGLATLGADSKVPLSQLPALAFGSTFVEATFNDCLTTSAIKGDVCVVSGANENWILAAEPAATAGNWVQLATPGSPITSVNGQIGNVSLTASNGLTLVGNTDFELGGTLEHATNIDKAGNNLTFTGSGNVGIGTSSPIKGLHVQLGGASLLTSSFGNGLLFSGNTGAGTRLYLENLAAGTDQKTLAINNEFGATTFGSLSDNGGSWIQPNILTLQHSNGNVGIGTSNPQQRLDVNGNVRFSGALMPAGLAGTSGQVLVSQGSGLAPIWGTVASSSCSTGSTYFCQDGNSFSGAATLGTNNNFALNFETNATTKMTVLANGNVGIGEATPLQKLHVAGGILADDGSATGKTLLSSSIGYPGIWFGNNASSPNITNYSFLFDQGNAMTVLNAPSGGRVDLRIGNNPVAFVNAAGMTVNGLTTATTTGTGDQRLLQLNAPNGLANNIHIAFTNSGIETARIQTTYTAGSSIGLAFHTYSGSLGERMRLTPDGSLGIGTTTPNALLTVNGTATKPGGGDWGTFSDKRLKKNIKDFGLGLDAIKALKPATFQYNGIKFKDDGQTYTGLIAQDVVGTPLEAFTLSKSDDGYYELDSSAITYALVNAVKEQQVQIDELKKAVWNGGLVTEDTTFKGLVKFEGEVTLSGKNTGTATIKAGQKNVDVVFPNSLSGTPQVTIGKDEFTFMNDYRITSKTKNGFRIEILFPQSREVRFDWHAFVSE